MFRVALSMTIALLLSACAVDYSGTPVTLAAKTDKTVAVAVSDQRPYVVSGNKTPDFVGLVRNTFGMPFDAKTSSGQPLASDFASTITRSLTANGTKVASVGLPPTTPRDQAVRLITTQGRDRSLLVTIDEWKSDRYMGASLDYALRVEIFDATGKVLATNSVQEKGGSGDGGDAARTAITRLLDAPAIIAALK